MEIRHLKLVKAIVEEGSITKAITKLHLTQSALSHQLREAEEQLGTQIFHRINKKLILTKAGEKFYETATEVLAKLSDTQVQIKKLVYGEQGEIRISTECYASYYWLPGLSREFQSTYPHVELSIILEGIVNPLQKLLDGQLDVAITSDPIKNDHIEYVELFEDEIVAVISRDHLWAGKKYVSAEDFAKETLIIHSFPTESVAVHKHFLAPAKVHPKKIVAVPFTEAAMQMVAANMGIVAMPHWVIKPYIKWSALKVLKVGKNGVKQAHYIAYLKNKVYPSYFTHFVEFMKQQVGLP